jgi:phosphomannomutase
MIKFGTDGWRGVISDSFTFENLRKLAGAHATVLKDDGAKRVVVGYDLRFMSEEYARFVAGILSGCGLDVTLASKPAPTPAVSFAVKYKGFDAGVVITASHNPGKYNGYKVKERLGGPARACFTDRIEANLEGSSAVTPAEFATQDLNLPYVEGVRSQLELSLVKNTKPRIVHDAMFGAQQGLLRMALNGTGAEVVEINAYRDPLFGGKHPEPVVEGNITALKQKVRAVKADIGIAHDGDGDRVGIVDEKGNFVNSQVVFALLLLHVVRNKGLKGGAVVKTVSSGYLIDRVCRELNIELIEVPVGFRNIFEVVLKKPVLFAGEESGGYALVDYLPERDGLLMGLLIVERMVAEGKSVSELVSLLFEEFGTACYRRVDLPVTEEEKEKLEDLKSNPPDRWQNLKVAKVMTIDGLKLVFEDDSWLLLRPSGTEPLFRVYAETPDEQKTQALVQWATSLIRRG